MKESWFSPPIIGPFIEPNAMTGAVDAGRHSGARMLWSNPCGAYQVNLLRPHDVEPKAEFIVCEPDTDAGLGDVLEMLLRDNSARVFDLLTELRPFIRLGVHTPIPPMNSSFLHPKLVQEGFALGRATRTSTGVSFPLVWRYPGQESKTEYFPIALLAWYQEQACPQLPIHRVEPGASLIFHYVMEWSKREPSFPWLAPAGMNYAATLFSGKK